jgi:hypothetical protein
VTTIDDDRADEPASAGLGRTRYRFALGLTLAAIVVAVVVVVLASTRSGDPVRGRALLDGKGPHGQATLFRDHVAVHVSDLPTAPAAHHFQVWLLSRATASPRSAGRLRPRRGAASLESRLPDGGPFSGFLVSLDPDSPAATTPGTSVVRGAFG